METCIYWQELQGTIKRKSTMKTFAIVGIVCSVIGLGLNLWNVYGYDPRLATNILLLFSVFLCNLNNFNE